MQFFILCLIALASIAVAFAPARMARATTSKRMAVAGGAAMPAPIPKGKTGKNIADSVKATGIHNTLAAALAATKLDAALSGDAPKLTLFAPTDEAFAKLPAGTVDALLKDLPKLTNILKYHVSANQQNPSRNGRSFDTLCLNADNTPKETGVLVTVDTCESFMLSSNTRALIVGSVEATNGLIHILDGVMLPYEGNQPPFGPGSESKDAGLASFNKDPSFVTTPGTK